SAPGLQLCRQCSVAWTLPSPSGAGSALAASAPGVCCAGWGLRTRSVYGILALRSRMTLQADGGFELLVPVPTAAGRHGVRGRRHAVRAGTVLARRRVPSWSLPRFGDARVLPLPSGPHTQISPDGMELRAACDGEVMLRNLLIEVAPMYVHLG